MYSGVGIVKKHVYGTDQIRNIMFGLMSIADMYTDDGMPMGFLAVVNTHVIEHLTSVFPSTVKVSVQFPDFPVNEDGERTGQMKVPHVTVKIGMGTSRELGVGRMLWDSNEGEVKGFNQIAYLEFSIWDRTTMKCDQLTAQIALQLQIAKGEGKELHGKGFQNFRTVRSEQARAFRYGMPYDFKMLHQTSELFHSRLTVRTQFDVVWEDKSDIEGVISQIVMGSTVEIPISVILGSSLAYLRLEQINLGWHGGFP